MKWPKKCWLFILAATIAAVALRLPRLQQRPMHGDEAVHAVKFGELLEKGSYHYNPDEYHGPTLNYFTLIPAWLGGMNKFKDLNEFTLRIVPVFFGVLLVSLVLLLAGGLGRPAAIVAALFTAISPAFVFYSRYYIQEILLVCFTFGVITSAYRYTRSQSIKWALLTGLFLGLMHATKETCIIALGSMLVALGLTLLIRRWQSGPDSNIKKVLQPWHIIVAVAVAASVSALFYSSFLTNARGVMDSFRAYIPYFNRAGQNRLHVHPWYYYLKMLIYSRYATGPIWSEALIVVLAFVGFVVAMTKRRASAANRHLLRFIAFYTAAMTVIYSAIPYKTPWCLLGFLHGMILLAAVAAVAVVRLVPNVLPRLIIMLILLEGGLHLTWQAFLGSYKFYADPCNPYVYAHPVNDVIAIARRIEGVARVHPDGHDMRIDVICPGDDYWPFPWYLRSFPYVGWWDKVNENAPPAPVIIASASVDPALRDRLGRTSASGQVNAYVPLFNLYKELRPQVELRCYVTKELWDSYQQYQVHSVLSRSGR